MKRESEQAGNEPVKQNEQMNPWRLTNKDLADATRPTMGEVPVRMRTVGQTTTTVRAWTATGYEMPKGDLKRGLIPTFIETTRADGSKEWTVRNYEGLYEPCKESEFYSRIKNALAGNR